MTAVPEPATPARVGAAQWMVLVVLVIPLWLTILDTTVLNVAVPTIQRDLRTSLPSLQWVLSGYPLVFATFQVIGGRLGDLYGVRRTFLLGTALFGTGSLIAASATSVPALVIGEAVVEGLGACLMVPALVVILSNTFQGPERATAYAVWGTAIATGSSFGPLLGGYLTEYHSWRLAFAINSGVALAAIVAALLVIPPDRAIRRTRLDLPGSALIAAGTFAVVFAVSQAPRYGWWRPLGGRTFTVIPWMLIASVVLTMLFVSFERAKERRGTDPLFAPSQFRHLGYRYGLLSSSAMSFGQYIVTLTLAIHLQRTRGLDPMATGLWLLPMGIGSLVGAQAAGRLTRRLGTAGVVRVGTVLFGLGLTLLTVVLGDRAAFLAVAPALVLTGLGTGATTAQVTNLVLSAADPEKAGVAAGMLNTTRQVAAAVGIAVVGAVLVVSDARLAVAIAVGGALLSVVCAARLPANRVVPPPPVPSVEAA